ncbi:MAG: GNAT family N-acetyltransferase [Prevotellaceae bacterium]|nr:GNAT family N-acetyltransferase [Prevotellaceae bacterium]
MITYRTAKPTDAEQLLITRRLTVLHNKNGAYSQVILHAWAPIITEETIAAEEKALENPDRVTIVAEDRNKMVGLCTIDLSKGLLQQCYVLPHYNGKGIARELVRQVETIAKDHRLSLLKLSSSLIALDFYKKQGYQQLNSYLYDLDNGFQMPCVMMEKYL